MSEPKPIETLIVELKERAKELNCLYEVQELLATPKVTLKEVCNGIIRAIPPGWQYPDICEAQLVLHDEHFQTTGFRNTDWQLCAAIRLQEETIGRLCVVYLEERPELDEGPFLKEERKLIDTIATQLGLHILHHQLKEVFEKSASPPAGGPSEWQVIQDLLQRTDPKLLVRIGRKMANYLYWNGIKEAQALLDRYSPVYKEAGATLIDTNRPFRKANSEDLLTLCAETFSMAAYHLSEKEVLDNMQKWIREERSGFLVNVLEDTGSSLSEISNAIERLHHLTPQGVDLSAPREKSFRVALISRLLSEQHDFIQIAKRFIGVRDFARLLQKTIYPTGSHGKLGGKSAGLFLARQILKQAAAENPLLEKIRTPKTWYLTSDGVISFMKFNNLEDIIEQKYKDIGQVRQEYPYVVHIFKNSTFAPEIIQGLSLALDDFGDVPLIVRSSSLLEDRLGAAFAGKYKSLFIANQGSKQQRLEELLDAISEVYASTFGPDPIEYRSEQQLLDYHEEMGILIQEVVGQKVGNYFLPAFAGVAFSNNEFPWSPRISRSDGLIRLVPGLGTRAVDRVSDDYPVLIAPGKPQLQVNVTLDEMVRYAPKNIDVINLEKQCFETISIRKLIRNHGREYPQITQVVSVLKDAHLQQARALGTDYKQETTLVTFEGLIQRSPFIKQIRAILDELQDKYGCPVDIEFAHDGQDFYLLQCRSQSARPEHAPAPIPDDLNEKQLVFTARKHISNGSLHDITHIVYVDPQGYSEIAEYQHLLDVGRVIGLLNKILPKRQFILMGPGRWGSRGDIKLGVNVTYSEINNTAMLIEIARKQKEYIPELSFGTHFFLDLVEADIRYLPLYPDEKGIVFNESFFTESRNALPDMLPDYAHLAHTIKVIDVNEVCQGQVLEILSNAGQGIAVARLTTPCETLAFREKQETTIATEVGSDRHWRWRLRSVTELAARLDAKRFGVKGLYLFGSTKNATAGPGSDIDIIVHFRGNKTQRRDLEYWLEGWSHSLAFTNYQRTGYKSDGLLDVHIITDADIAARNSYALKIGAVTDAARPLATGTALKQ